ncbi:MAG: DinB family protein [Anaerolineales bacterium]|nr:DinB family protein [Anaerolineales bacterium]
MNQENNLTQAVERFAAVTRHLSDAQLEQEWNWRAYSEGVRFAFFRSYEELRSLAARLVAERSSPFTHAQRALGQYHAAYRDLQAVLVSVEEAWLDEHPAQGEWPLRIILGHIIAAEREFFARIWHAVNQARAGEEAAVEMEAQEVEEFVGSWRDFERTMDRLSLPGILAYYDALHKRVLRELTDISDEELGLESLWWEQIPLTVEFRLHRLDAHLRQHTIQIEKTLEAFHPGPTEAQRLLRLVYAALAEVDGAIIGEWMLGRSERYELAATITQRAEELAALLNA